MKKHSIIILLCLLFISSCRKDISIEPLLEPQFHTNLPSFSLSHMYIIVREYEDLKLKDNFNQSKEEYFEKRLIELFPSEAYKGIYKDALEEADAYAQNYNTYSQSVALYNESLNVIDSAIIDDEYHPFISYDDDVNYLKLSNEEIQSFKFLDNIAFAHLNKNQIDSALLVPNRFMVHGVSFTPFRLPLVFVIKYSVFRIMQSKIRTDIKTEHYYPGNLALGSKGDAFRHIFVSMHLRRYLGRVGSSMVMSSYEYLNPNSNVRDKHMDLHNNIIGRASKYWTFRGGYFKHKYDWEKWAQKTKNYIDNYNNGVDMDWENNHSADYKKDADKVHSKKYIYYR